MCTANEETLTNYQPGDPSQQIPYFHRLFFEDLQTKDNGIQLDEITDSDGKFRVETFDCYLKFFFR